jgi:excisionase family DNA binding protein
MMKGTTEKKGTPALRIEQVALLCGVSVSRVHSWIEKSGLKFIFSGEERKVQREDLVGFLMHYNMPIPGGILPMNARKILFICPEKRGRKAGNEFFRLFSEQFCRNANCLIDSVTFGKGAEYKILTFRPDLILAKKRSTLSGLSKVSVACGPLHWFDAIWPEQKDSGYSLLVPIRWWNETWPGTNSSLALTGFSTLSAKTPHSSKKGVPVF